MIRDLGRRLAPAAFALILSATGLVFDSNHAAGAGELSEAIQAAIDHPSRPAADRERDAGRKPGRVLAFVGIEPGMTVLDVFSSSGYYAEMLSHLTGEKGRVIAHNNQSYLDFVGEAFTDRYAGGRLANVEHILAEANEFDAGDGVADAALLILTFHDIYYKGDPESESPWPRIDAARFLGNVYRALKPGGMVAVVDHTALAGMPRETGDTLHRIDPAIVREEMAAAGFEFAGEADFLANPDDPLDIPMYDPAIRGKTDRFVHLYRKPG